MPDTEKEWVRNCAGQMPLLRPRELVHGLMVPTRRSCLSGAGTMVADVEAEGSWTNRSHIKNSLQVV